MKPSSAERLATEKGWYCRWHEGDNMPLGKWVSCDAGHPDARLDTGRARIAIAFENHDPTGSERSAVSYP